MDFDRLTVKDLKNLARERGIIGYTRLRRNQLINLLGSNPGTPILVGNNENIGTPVLRSTITPTPVLRPTITPTPVLRPTITPPPTVTRVQVTPPNQQQLNVLKSNSALKNWAQEHKIPGINVSTPQEFLDLARPKMIKVLENQRDTKVKMVLQCNMTKKPDKDRQELAEANFSSEINEINLNGTGAGE